METPKTTTDASEGKPKPTSWATLNESLKESDGDRHEFFPLQQVADGETVTLTMLGDAIFDTTKFHGKFSMLEFDGRVGSTPYRFCISGARLAKALSQIQPGPGESVSITAAGPSGRERKWTATKKPVVIVTNGRLN